MFNHTASHTFVTGKTSLKYLYRCALDLLSSQSYPRLGRRGENTSRFKIHNKYGISNAVTMTRMLYRCRFFQRMPPRQLQTTLERVTSLKSLAFPFAPPRPSLGSATGGRSEFQHVRRPPGRAAARRSSVTRPVTGRLA